MFQLAQCFLYLFHTSPSRGAAHTTLFLSEGWAKKLLMVLLAFLFPTG